MRFSLRFKYDFHYDFNTTEYDLYIENRFLYIDLHSLCNNLSESVAIQLLNPIIHKSNNFSHDDHLSLMLTRTGCLLANGSVYNELVTPVDTTYIENSTLMSFYHISYHFIGTVGVLATLLIGLFIVN